MAITTLEKIAPHRNNLAEGKRASQGEASLGAVTVRILDIGIATLLLIFLAPLLVLVTGLLFAGDRRPAIQAHWKVGRNGRPFPCFKFRTQWARDFKPHRNPRMGWIGTLLRSSGIDDLPQLFNVLRGEMSIVGPRPIAPGEIERYGRYFRHYSVVKPGLTGLWQVSGRDDLSHRRRVALDILYARNKSLGLDLKILTMTVVALLLGKAIYRVSSVSP